MKKVLEHAESCFSKCRLIYRYTQSKVNASKYFTRTSFGFYHWNGVPTMGCSKCFNLGVHLYERSSIQVKWNAINSTSKGWLTLWLISNENFCTFFHIQHLQKYWTINCDINELWNIFWNLNAHYSGKMSTFSCLVCSISFPLEKELFTVGRLSIHI